LYIFSTGVPIPLNDRQIEQLIEFWRQEECLWKVTNKKVVAIISPAAGLCAKSIISPGRTDTEIYFQSGRTDT